MRASPVLPHLHSILKSKTGHERITQEEDQLLNSIFEKMKLDALWPTVSLGTALYVAAKKMHFGIRATICAVSSYQIATWRLNSSQNVHIDHILQSSGSRIQRELATLILTQHGDDQSKIKLVNKYFFREEVFKDLNPDIPTHRWRQRNSYADEIAFKTTEPSITESIAHEESNLQLNSLAAPHEDLFSDPLDQIFGYPESSNEAEHSGDKPLPRRAARRQKKAKHRRQALESIDDRST